jgi:hypothetical protein
MTQHDVHRREYGIASSALFKPKFRRDRSPAPRGHPVYPVTSPKFKPVFIPGPTTTSSSLKFHAIDDSSEPPGGAHDVR